MANTIRLTGCMPENWEKALCELADDLGFTVAETGIPVHVEKGEEPAVVCDGETVTITAYPPASDKQFAKWTTEDGVTFADATKSTTTFVMPAKKN